jgi:hypothetical protein
MWNIFKTNANEERQLVEKGLFFGNFWVHYYIEPTTEAIINILNCAAELQLSQPTKMDSQTESKLFAEILSFHLHVADRVALAKLSNKKREIFMEALFETTQAVAANCKRADFTIKEMFFDFYTGFELEHSKFIFDCGRNGCLFWEFSKRLSSMAHLQKGPIPHLLLIENAILHSIARLCLPTLMDKKKTSDDWSEASENVAKTLDELEQKHIGRTMTIDELESKLSAAFQQADPRKG